MKEIYIVKIYIIKILLQKSDDLFQARIRIASDKPGIVGVVAYDHSVADIQNRCRVWLC